MFIDAPYYILEFTSAMLVVKHKRILILSVLLWAPAKVGEKHCVVCPLKFVASQEYINWAFEEQ